MSANEIETEIVTRNSLGDVPGGALAENGLDVDVTERRTGEETEHMWAGAEAVLDLASEPDPGQFEEEARETQEHDAAASERSTLFSKHADELQRLSIAGLGSAMEDLGLLSNRSEKESNDVVVATFAALDTDKKNYLSSSEFATLYEKAKMPTLADVLREEHPALVERLQRAFVTWATFGKGNKSSQKDPLRVMMGSPSFIKLLRDAHVARSVEDVHHFDVAFAKVKERGASKVSFAQFVDGLRLVSEGDHCDLDLMSLVNRICEAAPSVNAAPSPRKKLDDDRVDGFDKDSTHSSKTPLAMRSIHIDVVATSNNDSLLAVFESYARFGLGKRDATTSGTILRLSSQQFAKLARESKLISRHVTAQKLDVIFASCKMNKTPKDRSRGLTFDEFVTSLSCIAKEEGVMPDYIMNKVRSRMDRGPMINSPALTSPGHFIRLHDDEQACCGVYGRRARRWSDAT